MLQEGQIVLFRFPQTDFSGGKLRLQRIYQNLASWLNGINDPAWSDQGN